MSFLLGILRGLGESYQKHSETQRNEEKQRRATLADYYFKQAERPDARPEARDMFLKKGLGIKLHPDDKKLPKELESIEDVMAGDLQAQAGRPQGPQLEGAPEGVSAVPAQPAIPAPPQVPMAPFYTPEQMFQTQLSQATRTQEALLPGEIAKAKATRQPVIPRTQSKQVTVRGPNGEPVVAQMDYNPVTQERTINGQPFDPSTLISEGPLKESVDMTPQGEEVVMTDDAGKVVHRTGRYKPRVSTETRKKIHPITGEETFVTIPKHYFTGPDTQKGVSQPGRAAGGSTTPSTRTGGSGASAYAHDPQAQKVISQTTDMVEQAGFQEWSKIRQPVLRAAVLDEMSKRGSLPADKQQKENIVEIGNVWDGLQTMRRLVEDLQKIPLFSEEAARKAVMLANLRQGFGRVLVRKIFLEVGNLSQSDVDAGLSPLPGAADALLWSKLSFDKLETVEAIVRRIQDGYINSLKKGGGLRVGPNGQVTGAGVIPPPTVPTKKPLSAFEK